MPEHKDVLVTKTHGDVPEHEHVMVGQPLDEQERTLARALFTSTAAPCLKCHLVGDPNRDRFATAPSFLVASARLKPTWTARWMLDPQAISPNIGPYFHDSEPPSVWTLTGLLYRPFRTGGMLSMSWLMMCRDCFISSSLTK